MPEAADVMALIEDVYREYGYDFRRYAYASLRRRVLNAVRAQNAGDVRGLRAQVLADAAAMESFVLGLSVHVTAMFRDPGFYVAFRTRVVPLLATYPHARIWVAGCSTGEELYSVAIVLEEVGLYDRCRLYATDLSAEAVRRASEGMFPLPAMKEYTANYLRAGGTRSFSDYYAADGGVAAFRASLRRNAVFAQHSLVTDGAPNEFHVILCRNVLIYFDAALQAHACQLFSDNLVRLGVLCLGRKESLLSTPVESLYEAIDAQNKIFRKVR